ncbi:SAC3/GANP/Nin1/mts3/eIF-3 p25 family-domain-containing protein [Aspergillus multicolor]|uniref:putative leucine permease transcriptional regulator (SAC3) n=1 Tax=Aspergillus multicolor TaxID=41759 RepID=UPI003CCDC476
MATPANPFAALHQNQTDGAATSTGRERGRGGPFSGATPFQPRGGSAFQPRGGSSNGPTVRGRGRGNGRARGAPTATRAGRGARGAGATNNTWRANKAEQQTTSAPTFSSPFAQLNQSQASTSPATSPATIPTPQQKPSFSGFGRASPTSFGAPSSRGGTAFNARASPQQSRPTNGVTATSVPVEDASAMGKYTDRYEQLKVDRAKQRNQAIKAGQMADPNQPMSLNKAITPVGTCTSMCPDFESTERIVQKMVDKSEKYLHPATNTLQNMEAKMLKRFRRSAAGYDEQLPSDIRTPGTLLQTMNYLTRHVIGGPEHLGIIHKFVWDRTRSIRNDFSVQQVTQEADVRIAVTCLERIARFHIMSLHLLSSPANEEPFDRHQEREQLNNTMLSLMYYYDDNRGRISFPNEDEFRAYYIIFSIHDQRPDLEARVQKWPPELRNAPRVRVALELFAAAGNTWEYQGTLDAKRPNAIAQGFYTRFFNLVNSPGVSYLMACVAEIYFNHMRQTAIRSIWKGYCRYPASQQHKNEEWTVDELTSVLCFDDDEQTIQFCADQGLEFAENANGVLYLNWGSRPIDSVAFQPSSDHSFSENCVEWKRGGRNLVAIVLGLNVTEAATLGMIDTNFLPERASSLAPEKKMSIVNDDSLFVSEDEKESPTSGPQPMATTNTTFTAPSTAFGGFSQSTVPQQFTNSQPFSSPFPANNAAATSAASSPSLNPFAKLFSPFPSSQPPQSSQSATSSLTPASASQSSNMFPNSDFSNSSVSGQGEKPATPPAATPFQFPTTSQPAAYQMSSPSLFPKPTASTSSLFGSTQSLFDVKSDQPNGSTSQPLSSTPFAASSSPFSIKPNQASGQSAGQSSTSIFDTAKPSPQAPSPSFSFSNPPQTASQTSTPQLFQPKPAVEPAPLSSFQSDSEKEPSSFFATPPKPQPTESIFKAPSSSLFTQNNTSSATSSAFASPETPAAALPNAKPSEATPVSQAATAPFSNGIAAQPSTSQPSIPDKAEPPVVDEPAPPAQLEIRREDTPLDASSAASAEAEEEAERQAEEEAKRQAEEEEEAKRQAWIKSLRNAAEKRRNSGSEPPSRKRVHEQDTPTEESAKPTKVQKPSPPPRKSMAYASMKPLPKLPILEKIEAMTARKPTEPEPEPPKKSQVDADDLLLSAARIAADSLRNGPRLITPALPAYDSFRSSYSPASSFSSLYNSRSVSPQQSQSSVNGYEVAFAPDRELGLGQSLSRTEQRIRMTGGRGLAYKPLNMPPKENEKEKKKKKKRMSPRTTPKI